MSKKALLSLVLIGVMALGLGIGSYAWFTSTATSENNVFTAGTLKLATEGRNSIEIPLRTDRYIQPGDVLTGDENSEEVSITVKNDGNLPMATFGRFTMPNNTGLADDIKITNYKVEFFNADGTPTGRTDEFIVDGNVIPSGMADNLFDWITGSGPQDIMGTPWDVEGLNPGCYYIITFSLQYDKDATEQGQAATIGYEVRATQVNKEAMIDLELEGVDDLSLTAPGWGMYDYIVSQLGL